MDEYYGQSSHCNPWWRRCTSRAQMSLQQELRYIEALSAIAETGQKMLVAGESALDGDGSGASAGRVSTV